MNIIPIDYSFMAFRKRIYYGCGGYIEKSVKKFKDKEVELSSNYIDNKLYCTLIYVKKAGEWLKSKLKYYKDGKLEKVLTSDNKNKVIWG